MEYPFIFLDHYRIFVATTLVSSLYTAGGMKKYDSIYNVEFLLPSLDYYYFVSPTPLMLPFKTISQHRIPFSPAGPVFLGSVYMHCIPGLSMSS